jgi:TRAP-type C4-dicarboxylate transport system permease large subunit
VKKLFRLIIGGAPVTTYIMARTHTHTRTHAIKVNKTLDLIERTFWTFLNSFLGLLTIDGLTALNISTAHAIESAAVAALYTTLKTLAAQRVGANQLGAAIPGQVLETR